ARGEVEKMGTPGFWGRATGRLMLGALGLAALVGAPTAALRAQAEPTGPSVKTFEIIASRFKFEPAVLEVMEGDTVVLTVWSADTIHGLTIKALGVKLIVPKAHEPVEVRFVAARAGTYEIACSEYCGSGHRRMKGQLVVGPAAPSPPKTSQ